MYIYIHICVCVCVDADLFGDSEEISFPDLLNTGADLIAVCFSTSDYSFFTCSYSHHTTHSLYTFLLLLPSSSPSSSPSLSLSFPLSLPLSLPLHLPPSLAIYIASPSSYTSSTHYATRRCKVQMERRGEGGSQTFRQYQQAARTWQPLYPPQPPPPYHIHKEVSAMRSTQQTHHMHHTQSAPSTTHHIVSPNMSYV